MTLPGSIQRIVERFAGDDRSVGLGLAAIVRAADAKGRAILNDVAIQYRDSYIRLLRTEEMHAEAEEGRIGLDEVRNHLARSVIPRLLAEGIVAIERGDIEDFDAALQIEPRIWSEVSEHRSDIAEVISHTGEYHVPPVHPASVSGGSSVLEAVGLVKTYKRRNVVKDVALQLQQGEIVGLLGPNGAGKTTTFYMIVGLIQPNAGKIMLDGEDITGMPMYKRARQGIGYLSQEPSIFRKLSVEDNILAILETLPLSSSEREEKLEMLLDELSIKRLRKSMAYALSGGERRRLEITRALVTDPKFMMLDEPFAGVDPIAVHDIQTIVAGLRHRGIGVLISDHNVEQTLDIVDRAYIMFDGQVKVSGTVRELVFDDTVADIYLGPTLTARLRQRFAHLQTGASAGAAS